MDEKEQVPMKTCKGKCGRSLPLTAFGVSRNTLDGHEGKCKECRRAEQNESYRKRTADARKIGKSRGLPARKKVEEYVLPPEGYGPVPGPDPFEIPAPMQCGTIAINFAKHPDLLQAVSDLAETEFRPLEMQVLYLLKRQIDQVYPNQLER